MDVHWLEQISADLPAGGDWLSSAEAERLAGMRFPKRRADWLLGRWTAKRAVSLYLNLPADPGSLSRVEIGAAASGAPDVFLEGERAPLAISLSHRDGRAVCAIAAAPAMLGCDLEIAEPRSAAFATDYFTAAEQELLVRATPLERVRLLALLWSAKESVLKALRVGLRIDTRCVDVDPNGGRALGEVRPGPGPHTDSSWRPLRACHDGQVFHGWWRQTGELVRTMVAVPVPASPVIAGRSFAR